CDTCPALSNPGQVETDDDGQGDLCDLDDGTIYILWVSSPHLYWQQETGWQHWNLYFGSLAVLRSSGVYTQIPGSNPLASRQCDLASPDFSTDAVVPAAGQCRFALATGRVGSSESDLGRNSAGALRPNANPCP